MGKRKGRCVKKNAVSKQLEEPENLVKAPHSFVIHRGQVSKDVVDLTKDFRQIMEPFTASQLKERKTNTIKDFLSISGYLHVSHMMIFTETELGTYMRLARLPRGPTLTFRVHQFALSRDVRSSLRKQYVIEKAFQHAPLIVLNSFSGEGMHMKLMATMFQNMFPTINITTVKLKNIRRCVLMNYNPSTKMVDLRHYVIRAIPVGLNKGTKKVVQGKIPNLNKCKDMSEFFDKAALLSESEFEDDNNQIVLPQTLSSRGAAVNSTSAIRLVELGPRISFQLIKVEDGLMDGEVLFHELIEKTDEEKAYIKKKREEKRRQKEKRKSQQEENIKRKQREKEELKQKSMEGIKKKKEVTENQRLMELAAAESQTMEEDDDDAEYYRKEVGAEPEKDLFSANPRKRKTEDGAPRGFKKMRLDRKTQKRYQNTEDRGNRNNKGKDEWRKNKDVQGQKKGFRDKGHGQGERGRNQGERGQNRGERGQNRGERGQNRGERGQNRGERGQKRGERGNDQGRKPFGKGKKVFSSKINKFGKAPQRREGKMKGKGKGRK